MSLKEAELLANLKDNRKEDRALEYVYRKYHSSVCRVVLKLGAVQQDAEDIFQESVIILYENVRAGKFQEKSSLGTYLTSIAKYRWLKKLRKAQRLEQEIKETTDSFWDAEDFWIAREEQEGLVTSLLQNMGETCLKVLTNFYYKCLSMKAIANLMGFKNEQVARNKKSKCLKALRDKWKDYETQKH